MSKPKFEIAFMPGCFDDFEGTPEELQELIAELARMAEDGTLLENSRLLTDDEIDEINASIKVPRH